MSRRQRTPGVHHLLAEIREFELEVAVREFPPPPARVLEIGAGSGWQSSLLASRGYEVVAVDVAGSTGDPHHPVLHYDGERLPFRDGSFDVVFSSNVLEHVNHLPELLADVRRVLASGGWAVHVIPTTSWRAVTLVTFYLSRPGRVIDFARARFGNSREPVAAPTHPPGRPEASDGATGSKLRRFLVEPPHGEFPSAVRELTEYRAARWRQRLEDGGTSVTADRAVGLIYSGYGVAPWLPMRARRAAAAVLGSACRLYVVR